MASPAAILGLRDNVVSYLTHKSDKCIVKWSSFNRCKSEYKLPMCVFVG